MPNWSLRTFVRADAAPVALIALAYLLASGLARARVLKPLQLDRLGTDEEITLFRIAQESLANVHRQPGASEVKINIQSDQGTVRMEIADNGHGFPSELLGRPAAGGAMTGVGLLGMRERVSQQGGGVRLESEGGARIVVAPPIGGLA